MPRKRIGEVEAAVTPEQRERVGEALAAFRALADAYDALAESVEAARERARGLHGEARREAVRDAEEVAQFRDIFVQRVASLVTARPDDVAAGVLTEWEKRWAALRFEPCKAWLAAMKAAGHPPASEIADDEIEALRAILGSSVPEVCGWTPLVPSASDLRRRVDAVAGDLAAEGPVRAADALLASILQKSAKTVQRARKLVKDRKHVRLRYPRPLPGRDTNDGS